MEKSIQKNIREILNNSLKKIKLLNPEEAKLLKWEVSFADNLRHGDYTSNIALILAKHFSGSAEDLAEALIKNIQVDHLDWLAKIEIAKPGFINFWLSPGFLENNLRQVLRQRGKYGRGRINKTVVVEYSSPNIAKSFGIGHLRSTIIGQAIYNLYKFIGWKCIGVNHFGDWGTQFGKIIVAIHHWGHNSSKLTLRDLEKLYIKFHVEKEKDPSLDKEAREWFKKLENKDPAALKIWKRCVRLSRKEFDRIYELLGVKIDYPLGESFYLSRTREMIKEILSCGLARKSQGALILPLPGFETPLLLEKSDGATTYAARDLAALKYRQQRWHPQLMIWEVGREQEFYFQQLFSAATLLGYASREQMIHIPHGLIRWAHGKFSTRKGHTIHLDEVLNKAIEKAHALIEDSQSSQTLTRKEKEKIAQKVGIGAIKFYDLSHYPKKDIIFNWKEVLNLEGNSGPYLQYSIVRGRSVLQKAGRGTKNFSTKTLSPEEEAVLRMIAKFPVVVREAASKFSPNLIANFALELAQAFNLFYQRCPILNAPADQKKFRLALTEGAIQVLTICLSLLGVPIPSKM